MAERILSHDLPGSPDHRLSLLYASAATIAQEERFDFSTRHWAQVVAEGADRILDERSQAAEVGGFEG